MIKVALAEKEILFAENLKYMLEKDRNFIVLGKADNYEELEKICKEWGPDVILADIDMLDWGISNIKKIDKRIKIIALSVFDDVKNYKKAVRSNVDGYILKDTGFPHIASIIRSVISGYEVFYTKGKHWRMISGKENNDMSNERRTPLLERNEITLIGLLIEGKNYGQMGKILKISEEEVREMFDRILNILDLKDNYELAVYAVKNKII